MDASLVTSFEKLKTNLDELVKLYRGLLDLVRKEKDLLLTAQLEPLNESNRTKEALLAKIRAIDLIRERNARDLAQAVGADTRAPRLLEIAQKLQGQGPVESDRLRQLHSTLVLMIERVAELNRDNARFTESALHGLNMALGEVKNTLGGKKTYEKKGKMTEGPNKAGNFVSKEI